MTVVKKTTDTEDTHTSSSNLGLEKQEFVSSKEEITNYLKKGEFVYIKNFLKRYQHNTNAEVTTIEDAIIDIIAPSMKEQSSLIVPLLWTKKKTMTLMTCLEELKPVMSKACYKKAIKKALEKQNRIDPEILSLCWELLR